MQDDNGRRTRRARHWPYVVTGVVFAGVMGWISYTDALFVTRLAGNDGGIAYAYPSLPDGMLIFALLALTEAARAGVPRPRWATAGLVLGAGATLAANVGAGLAHSTLDAVIDGLVPVFFFIAVEIVLWHVRRGRGGGPSPGTVPAASGAVPSSNYEAAKARMQEAAERGFRYTDNQAAADFGLKRAEVTRARSEVNGECIPATATGTRSPGRAPHPAISPGPNLSTLVVVEDEVNAAQRRARKRTSSPAGVSNPSEGTAPAGASGRDATSPNGVPAAPNGGRPRG